MNALLLLCISYMKCLLYICHNNPICRSIHTTDGSPSQKLSVVPEDSIKRKGNKKDRKGLEYFASNVIKWRIIFLETNV